MQRRRVALLASLLLGSVLSALIPAGPASATTPTVCAGTGDAGVSPGLFYPVSPVPQVSTTGSQTTVLFHNPHRVSSWTVNLVGACTNGGSGITGSGSLQGYCGHSTGIGTSSSGHKIQWISAGGFLILTNGWIGIANAIPNVAQGQSCAQTSLASPGASQFLVQGVGIPTNCTGGIEVLEKGLTSDTTGLPFFVLTPTVHVVIPVPHVHWSVHICLTPTFSK